MKCYLAGKITGDPDYRRRFADARMVLEHLGHVVLDPSDLPDGLEYEQYMAIDAAMMDAADAICMLPNWTDSPGARREYLAAIAAKKAVVFYENVKVRGAK